MPCLQAKGPVSPRVATRGFVRNIAERRTKSGPFPSDQRPHDSTVLKINIGNKRAGLAHEPIANAMYDRALSLFVHRLRPTPVLVHQPEEQRSQPYFSKTTA